jgi:hypothetical protein
LTCESAGAVAPLSTARRHIPASALPLSGGLEMKHRRLGPEGQPGALGHEIGVLPGDGQHIAPSIGDHQDRRILGKIIRGEQAIDPRLQCRAAAAMHRDPVEQRRGVDIAHVMRAGVALHDPRQRDLAAMA